MIYPRYTRDELIEKSLENLYRKLIGYRIHNERLERYKIFVRAAKEMAISNQIPSHSIEIRDSGIYKMGGSRTKKKTKIA